MSTEALEPDGAWVPQACTLPTADRPLRVAEFDELFATSLRGLDRHEPAALRITLEPTPEIAARTADLMVRETGCCSFFTFSLVTTGDGLRLDIAVTETQLEVLDALEVRAATAGAER
jgi:hypothetical protein